jgi:hypothetical protein
MARAELAKAACDAGDGHGCAYLAALCGERLIYPRTGDQCSVGYTTHLRERAVAMLDKDCAGWGAYDCYRLAAIYWPGDPETAHHFAAASCRGGDPHGCDPFETGLALGRAP